MEELSLEDRREKGNMIEIFKYIKGVDKILEGSFFNIKQKLRTQEIQK